MEKLYDRLRDMVRGDLQEGGKTRFTASQLQLLDSNLREAAAEYKKRNEQLMLSGLRAFSKA